MTDDAEGVHVTTPPVDSAEPPSAVPERRAIPALTAVIVLIVVALDQLAKRWAVSELTGKPPRHVVWTLQFNLTRNSGMAFSQGQGIGPLIGIGALLVVLWLAWSARKVSSRVAAVAAGLIAGGAIGNLADRLFRGDRVLRGAVIDFIDFQWFPIFNVADMAIDVGGVLFVLWSLFGHRVLKAKAPAS